LRNYLFYFLYLFSILKARAFPQNHQRSRALMVFTFLPKIYRLSDPGTINQFLTILRAAGFVILHFAGFYSGVQTYHSAQTSDSNFVYTDSKGFKQ